MLTALLNIIALLFVSAGIVFADAFWFERFFFRTKKIYIGTAKKRKKNIRVVQISDLHLGSIKSHFSRLTNKLNKLQPDLVLFTGDAIDDADDTGLLEEFLQKIDHSIRKVAVLGNWEYQGKVDLAVLNKIYTDNNCRLLINETAQYTMGSKTISITGLDDYLRGNPDYSVAIKGCTNSDYHIVLIHCPEYSDHIPKHLIGNGRVDFILSGHTHGGQFNFFGFIPYLPKGSGRYANGWYNNDPKLFVSKGVGTVVVPARFGARAEIVVFNLAT